MLNFVITEMSYVEILLPQAFFIIVCYSESFKDYFNLFMLKHFRFFFDFQFRIFEKQPSRFEFSL